LQAERLEERILTEVAVERAAFLLQAHLLWQSDLRFQCMLAQVQRL
jgi:hypothetical protein